MTAGANCDLIGICVVEDDAGFRSGLERLLGRTHDFRHLGSFTSGEAGLQKIPEIKPDVVIMDLNLPGMNGVECVRKQGAFAVGPNRHADRVRGSGSDLQRALGRGDGLFAQTNTACGIAQRDS